MGINPKNTNREPESPRTTPLFPIPPIPTPELLGFPLRHQVLQPREWKNEQGREHVPEQEVDPDQRRVKSAQAKSDPQCAQRSVRLHFFVSAKSCFSNVNDGAKCG